MIRKLLLIVAVITAMASCRTLTPEEKAAKAEKEAVEHKLDSVKFLALKQDIINKSFVLEAHNLIFKRGNRAYVNSSTNFIACEGDKAVVQVAPFNGGGPNGVGGITVEGGYSKFETKSDKRGNFIVKFYVSGTGISADVTITLMKDSGKASAYISPSFNSRDLTLEGDIVPFANSSVIKGYTW
ncbi:MAG: DUF4251 domain-containing protein [Muribaculaceae bacterium]|nr:DUF4251 domain-containing protein [Muribaculaceae bacterium]